MIGLFMLGFAAGVITALGAVAWRVEPDDWDDEGWDCNTQDYTDEDDEDDYVYDER